MAGFKEWEGSLKEMGDTALVEVIRAMWALKRYWPLFSQEYKGDLLFLQAAAREERATRAPKEEADGKALDNLLEKMARGEGVDAVRNDERHKSARASRAVDEIKMPEFPND